jgi:hypothetical protein
MVTLMIAVLFLRVITSLLSDEVYIRRVEEFEHISYDTLYSISALDIFMVEPLNTLI